MAEIHVQNEEENLEKYSMEHCHPPTAKKGSKADRNTLIVVSVVCFVFLIAEIVGGILSNSLALLTDAAHLASDLASFAISLVSLWLAKKPATKTMSFGYHRAEICGAMISVFIIWVMTGVLVYLAVERVIHKDFEINGDTMLVTSCCGILFNVIMAAMLNFDICRRCNLNMDSISHGHSHGFGGHEHSHGGQGHNREGEGYTKEHAQSDRIPLKTTPTTSYHTLGNVEDGEDNSNDRGKSGKNILIRAALIHVLGDLIQSIGVFVAAIIIKCKPDWTLVDPVCTFLFSVLVLITTFSVLRDTFVVLMEGVPRNVDFMLIKKDLQSINGVRSMHSLHIWSLTMEKNAVVVHLAVDNDHEQESVKNVATGLLRHKYQMYDTHVQTERYRPEIMDNCKDCSTW